MTDETKILWLESRIEALEKSRERHSEALNMLRLDVKGFQQQREINATLAQIIKDENKQQEKSGKLWDRLITLAIGIVSLITGAMMMLAKLKGLL